MFVTNLLGDTFVSETKELLLKQYEAGACAVLKTYAIFHPLKVIILLSKLLTTIIQCFSWPPATLNIHFIAFTVLPCKPGSQGVAYKGLYCKKVHGFLINFIVLLPCFEAPSFPCPLRLVGLSTGTSPEFIWLGVFSNSILFLGCKAHPSRDAKPLLAKLLC